MAAPQNAPIPEAGKKVLSTVTMVCLFPASYSGLYYPWWFYCMVMLMFSLC